MIKTIYIYDRYKKEFENEEDLNEAFVASKISSWNGKIKTATIGLCPKCSKEFIEVCNKFIGKES